MNYLIRFTIFFFLTFWIISTITSQDVSAQCCPPADSLLSPDSDSTRVEYFLLNLDSISARRLIDYPLFNPDFHQYNPIRQQYPFYQSLGNTGQYYQPLTFEIKHKAGFEYRNIDQEMYLFKPDRLKFYRTLKPFTEINYVMGAKKENVLNVSHSQNIYKGLIAGIDYNLINSIGFYQRQRTNHSHVAVKLHYSTPNRRYGIAGYYYHNRIFNYENGGIAADSIFEENLEANRAVVAVNRQNAQTRYREGSMGFQQYFQLSAPYRHTSDSLQDFRENKLNFILGRLSHEFSYNKKSYVYSDEKPDSAYYRNFYYDSIRTLDSTGITSISNQIGWTNTGLYNDKEPIIRLYGGIRHSLINIRGRNIASNLSQVTYLGKVGLSLWPKMQISGKGHFTIGDYNNLDYYLEGNISQNVGLKSGKTAGIEGSLIVYSHDPAWFMQKYYSNHFKWNHDFGKQNGQIIAGYLNLPGNRAGVEIHSLTNLVTFGTDTLPMQSADAIGIIKLSWQTRFRIKNWYGSANLIYQALSNTNDLNLPSLLADVSFYYARNLFNNALFAQFGFDARFMSAYKAMSYDPSLGSFYNQDWKTIGNYPYVDIFVQFKIKRTLLFFKYEHINATLGTYDYFTTPHYPLPDAAFKYGVRWRFHD